MARRYDRPLSVHGVTRGAPATGEAGAPGDAPAPGEAPTGGDALDGDIGPRSFVWRGRRYVVCTVLASWQERRAWWREVGEDPGALAPDTERRVTERRVTQRRVTERRVWRVEARAPAGATGVFDLGRDDDHWLLLRAHD